MLQAIIKMANMLNEYYIDLNKTINDELGTTVGDPYYILKHFCHKWVQRSNMTYEDTPRLPKK